VCVGTGIAGCCLADADCDDANACTTDLCIDNACSNPDAPLPEAPPCFVFICDPEIGGINVDVPVTCVDDGDICTIEVCDPSIGTTGACVTNPNPNPPEGSQEISCEDGLDNDCDGLVDGDDGDCSTCTPDYDASEATCSDGLDNDCDGFTDSADPGCGVQCAADPCDPDPCSLSEVCYPIPPEVRETYGCYLCAGVN
jgi:hypothetical protein